MNAPRLTLIALLSLPLAACGAGRGTGGWG